MIWHSYKYQTFFIWLNENSHFICLRLRAMCRNGAFFLLLFRVEMRVVSMNHSVELLNGFKWIIFELLWEICAHIFRAITQISANEMQFFNEFFNDVVDFHIIIPPHNLQFQSLFGCLQSGISTIWKCNQISLYFHQRRNIFELWESGTATQELMKKLGLFVHVLYYIFCFTTCLTNCRLPVYSFRIYEPL